MKHPGITPLLLIWLSTSVLPGGPSAFAQPMQRPDAGSAAIWVQTVREPTDQEAGIVWVMVASALVRAGTGFRFSLPRSLLAQAAASAEPVQATTLAGQTLPAWLRYDPQARAFVASAVPADALPLQVRVGIGKRSAVLTISEARGERAPQPKIVVERSPAALPDRRG